MERKISIKTIILLLLTITSVVNSYAQLTFDDIPLTWNDFKRVEVPTHGKDANIYHSFRRTFDFLDSGKVIVNSELYIDTAKSQVRASALEKGSVQQKQLLLLHEKGHVLMSLVYHKMLEKSLASILLTCWSRKEMDSLYRKFERSLDAVNDQYDAETKYGTDYYKQKAWEKKLLEQLNSTYPDKRPIPLTFSILTDMLILFNKQNDPLSYNYCKNFSLAFGDFFDQSGWKKQETNDIITATDKGLVTVNNYNNTTSWNKRWHPSIDYSRDFEIDFLFQIEKMNPEQPYGFNLYWGLDTVSGSNASVQINTMMGKGLLTKSPGKNKESIMDTFTFKKSNGDGAGRISVRKIKDKYYIFLNNRFVKEMPFETLSGQEILLTISGQTTATLDHLNIYYLN